MEINVEEIVNKLVEVLALYSPRVIAAILIFLIGRFISKVVVGLIAKGMNKSKVDPTLTGFIKNLLYAALLTFVVIATINKLGIQTTSIVAIIGAAGLAVGLALQ